MKTNHWSQTDYNKLKDGGGSPLTVMYLLGQNNASDTNLKFRKEQLIFLWENVYYYNKGPLFN